MCGIFALVIQPHAKLRANEVALTLDKLFQLSERRGREAAGIAIFTGDVIETFKRPGAASKMIRSAAYKSFINDALGHASNESGIIESRIMAIGHSRLVTNGSGAVDSNNQPVALPHCIGVHNGIVVNADQIWQDHQDLSRQSDVDSGALFALISNALGTGDDLNQAIARAFKEIEGAATIAVIADHGPALGIATNTGSLYAATEPAHRIALAASERVTVDEVLKTTTISRISRAFDVAKVSAGHILTTDPASADWLAADAQSATKTDASEQTSAPIEILLHSLALSKIKRCTRCILPSTFPFIEFDSNDVCSVCRNWHSPTHHGIDRLRALADQHRRNNGDADCLVAFSGGRDSSYGLHFIKKELGLNPIAYTFDWGMVTDLARRNQSRMCGKLGIEHIIRSPDIAKKRRNIRRNLDAWLASPDLGMIPLLMAGDKQMYQIGRDLRKETGVDLVFFCAGNELERTEFKSGFCGLQENAHGQVLWKYSLLNKIKLAAYYAGAFIKNPRYINVSVPDTLSAYASTYIAKDDFAYLYHYIPWDEDTITKTLDDKYGWERALDTENTWRIGDGTAAFYNYIYYTVAGFSEHDTFRANQVRVGLISREEAMGRIKIDNQPRYAAMRSYAELVGMNLDEALLRINAIPKLY